MAESNISLFSNNEVITPKVQAELVATNKLNLNTYELNGVTENPLEGDKDKLITSFGSLQMYNELNEKINELKDLLVDGDTSPEIQKSLRNIDKIISSTLTTSKATSPEFYTNRVITDRLSLGNYELNGVTNDPLTGDHTKLVTAFGFLNTYNNLNNKLEELHGTLDKIHITPVLSEPLLPLNFIGNNWSFHNWYVDNGYLFYNNSTNINDDNFIKILSTALIDKGSYFIYIDINRLDNGKLTIINENNIVLKEITTAGIHMLTANVNNPASSFFTITANNTSQNCVISISQISVHYVKNRFHDFMNHLVLEFESGGSGFLSVEDYNTFTNELKNYLLGYTNTSVNSINTTISEHLSMDNPHGITTDTINAAKSVHEHNQYALATDVASSLTNLESTLSSSIENKIEEAVANVTGSSSNALEDHKKIVNAHNVTLELLDGANKIHEHIPSECGAAPVVHTHTVGDIAELVDIVTELEHTTLEVNVLSQDVANHVNDFNNLSISVNDNTTNLTSLTNTITTHLTSTNPHGTTKADIGLSDVVNGSFATDQEAVDGISADKYISPSNLRSVINSLSSDNVTSVIHSLTPRVIYKLKAIADEPTTISLKENKLYQILLSCSNSEVLSINFVFNNDTVTDDSHSCFYESVDTSTSKIGSIGFTIDASNSAGRLNLDTSYYTIDGVFTHLNDSELSVTKLYGRGYNIENFTGLTITTNCECSIKVFEFMAPDISSQVVDALPIGSIVTRFGNKHVLGYSVLDGSTLSATEYSTLLNYALESDQVVESFIYDGEIDTNGYCFMFGYTAGDSTFRLPIVPSTNNMYSYIKITDVVVPTTPTEPDQEPEPDVNPDTEPTIPEGDDVTPPEEEGV